MIRLGSLINILLFIVLSIWIIEYAIAYDVIAYIKNLV
jgi:hypothetical protein